MARLILEFNQEVLKDYPIRSRSITIGRQEDNTIVLDNPRVSGYHARIDKTGSDYVLTDLQSTNGTFVNNENVVSRRLLHGDCIRIGEHVLLFVGTEKAKVEAERENIPLNQTVMIGVKPKSKDVSPLPEIERPEYGIREVKGSRPYRRITPIFIAIFIVVVGGWLLLSHGPFLIKMILERTTPSETVGDASKISDREPINTRVDRTRAVNCTNLFPQMKWKGLGPHRHKKKLRPRQPLGTPSQFQVRAVNCLKHQTLPSQRHSMKRASNSMGLSGPVTRNSLLLL